MSINNLERKMKNRERSICRNYASWILNPERCEAAKKYTIKAGQFAKSVIKDSHKDTKNNMKLLEQRIKSREHKNLYPINNHDFDYKTAVKKKYNVFNQGITNDPTMNNLIGAPNKLLPYLKAMIDEPYPSRGTTAGVDDIIGADKGANFIKTKYRELNHELPYPSFRKDYPACRYPTNGENASSYFIKAGTCSTKINDEGLCNKKGYKWVPNPMNKVPAVAKKLLSFVKNKKNKAKPPPKGSCYKPRFAYIDNSAKGIFNKKGFAPSMFNDLMNVAPDKIFNILAGYTVDGSGLLPCVEEFTQHNNNHKLHILTFLIIIFLIYLLFKHL
ncbi:hypothetical protein N8751_01155 [bacterium]|nr:hypothetical protein [bacterium]